MWVYICDQHPIEYALKDEFWRTCHSNLMPGDSIRLMEMKNGRITAVQDLIVTAKDDMQVQTAAMMGMQCNPNPAEAVEEEPGERVEYIHGDGQIEWKVGKRIWAVKADGKIVCEVEDKALASAIARGDEPIPHLAMKE